MASYRAAALYDGGWRSEDRDQLMQEYDLTDQEADEISTELAEIEKEIDMHYKVEVFVNNGGIHSLFLKDGDEILCAVTGLERAENDGIHVKDLVNDMVQQLRDDPDAYKDWDNDLWGGELQATYEKLYRESIDLDDLVFEEDV